jgi:hypothetical protein
MIPHERSLVERLKNEPFALVGINTDKTKDFYRKKAKELGVTWRSSWQGSTGGVIPTKWGIEGFPTLYLIDAKGVIRKSWLGGPDAEELDKEVDALVKEAKAGH